jgi:hypothetical protein
MKIKANFDNLIIGNNYELVFENENKDILSPRSRLVNVSSNIYPPIYSFTNSYYNNDHAESDIVSQFKQSGEGYHCQFVGGLFLIQKTALIHMTKQDQDQDRKIHPDKQPTFHPLHVYLA